jgi:uncharacterized membrane protein
MDTPQQEATVYQLFRVSIILKGLISFAEIVAGSIIFFIPPAFITTFLFWIAHLLFGPTLNGALASRFVETALHYSTGTAAFVGLYLLSRGLIKFFLIIALLRNILWAYPASIVVLGLFILYQSYQILTIHSIVVGLITAFDLVVVYFIIREYQIVRRKRADLLAATVARN